MSRHKIVIAAEGDPTTRDCWSGTGAGLYREFVSRGYEVVGLDASLTHPARGFAAASTWSPDRRRWAVKYHLVGLGRRLRSRKATALVSEHLDADLILQFGATFQLDLPVPHWVYADANIELAREAAESGHSDASQLTDAELRAVFVAEMKVYENASGIFAMSERCRRSFLDRFHLPGDHVRTVFAGANYDSPPDLHGVGPRDEPVVLFVGRAFKRKGGEVLLEAFAKARDAVPGAELWIVGPDHMGLQQAGVREFGFIDKDQPGGEARIRELYDAASVFCLPTEYEPFGIAFVEAMMHQLPCVGPRAWAVPEIITDGKTGLLFGEGEAESLTAAMIRLLQTPDLARTMGVAGRERAMERFTWPVVARRMLQATAEMQRDYARKS